MKLPCKSVDQHRRRLLAGAAGVAALGGGFSIVRLALAKNDDEAVSSLTRWGLLIDTTKCASDCDACVSACNDEHNLEDLGRPLTDAQWIRKVDLEDEATGEAGSLPMLCQHCADPPCVDVCPTGASFRRDDGIVLVDKHICIGCRYCVIACPYKARSFVHETLHNQRSWSPRGKGTVEGCNLCVHRVDAGGTPACVEACSSEGGGAMLFGDLGDADSAIAAQQRDTPADQVRADLGLDTGVRYRGLR